jgi:hypothetical protein
MENFSQGAEWTTRYKNNLPDSAFLYIEAGGKKDSEGKTKPRSLRHFPYKDADGKVDRAHILNAISRIPQAKFLSQAQKDRLQARARRIYLKFVKYNSKKANSFDLLLNKLAAAVHEKPSVSKAMGEWYEDLSFYNAESMKIDEMIKDISVIIKESECLKKCLESETFLLGTWEETLKTSVLDSLFLLPPNNNVQPNNLEISALTHAQIINWLKENCTGCFNKLSAAVNLRPSMPMDNVPTQNPYEWSENKEFKRIINNLDGARVVCENAKKPENMQRIYRYWLGLIAIRPALDAIQQQAALRLYIISILC